MSSLIPEKVKDQYSSTLADAQSAMSNLIPPSAPLVGSLSKGFGGDHEKNPATNGHRNETAHGYHNKDKKAPKDVDEFIVEQIVGKQDDDVLKEKFPVDESVWHGYVDVRPSVYMNCLSPFP